MQLIRCAALGAISLVAGASVAQAQTPAEFYKGKQIQMMVYSGAGSTYDTYARLLARHMHRYIPGSPNIVVQNMVGAGGLKLVDYLNRIAPKDGSVFGTVSRGNPFDPIMGKKDIEFDPLKLTWIGSMNDEVSVCVSMASSQVTTFSDLGKEKLIVGAAGAGNDDDLFPRIMNAILGTKMQIITAYPGGNDVVLAMERGEVMGRCGWSWSSIKASWQGSGSVQG
jgi:tripartite-type tricarboxylate transporter receptor subunit TctC